MASLLQPSLPAPLHSSRYHDGTRTCWPVPLREPPREPPRKPLLPPPHSPAAACAAACAAARAAARRPRPAAAAVLLHLDPPLELATLARPLDLARPLTLTLQLVVLEGSQAASLHPLGGVALGVRRLHGVAVQVVRQPAQVAVADEGVARQVPASTTNINQRTLTIKRGKH